MRKLIFFVILIFAGAVLFLLFSENRKTSPVSKAKRVATEKVNSNMKIVSSAFQNNAKIPSIYTCDGKNVNPPLGFIDVPNNTKNLALIVDDPDAPSKIWVHWVIYNIDPKAQKVEENSVPQGGVKGMTDFGRSGYGGPCPPPASPEQLQRGESGTHRYFFKLYALDATLDLPKNATKQMVEEKMQGHIIDKTELIGLYGR
jgi:hypothetical protein